MDNSTASPARLTQLIDLQSAFASSIPLVDAATPVPWCGDWTVRDLVAHLAEVHHWVTAMVSGDDHQPLPPTDDLVGRYRESAAELADLLARLDPDAPARTLVGAGTVGFWHRRQVHETLIHLWDLRTAGGWDLVVDRLLWVDAVDEVVTVLHPRQVRLGRASAPRVRIVLISTDVSHSWTLPAAEGALQRPGVTVSGPAEVLALLLWGRTGATDARLVVTGDSQALTTVLAEQFVP